jgi:HAD superfamily hydrolase (TIGR01509 family)
MKKQGRRRVRGAAARSRRSPRSLSGGSLRTARQRSARGGFKLLMRAVIFDVDGTLIDSVDLHVRAWVEALKHFGFEADFDDVRANIGKGGDQLAPGFVPPDALEARGEEMERYRTELFRTRYLGQVKPFPGVRQLLERIRQDGSAIAVASSSKSSEVTQYLKIADIEDLVDVATSSDDAERSKPFPDIFQAALDKLPQTSSGEAVVVGDTPYDAEAARGAGLACVGVLSGGFTRESLVSAGCVAVYRDPEDLLRDYAASPLAAQSGA